MAMALRSCAFTARSSLARSSLRAMSTTGARPAQVLIMGPPGGGKGTLSKRLVRDFGLTHVSSGDALRAQIAAKTDLGLAAQKKMAAGEMVPDEIVMPLVVDHLKALTAKGEAWLLDGVPRTVQQAQAIDAAFDISLVLNLDVPAEEIVERMRLRTVHLASGRVYHAVFSPPKVEGVDDETGEELITREDDKPETVRARLEAYERMTRPLVQHYENAGSCRSFRGNESNVIWPRMKEFCVGRRLGAFSELGDVCDTLNE